MANEPEPDLATWLRHAAEVTGLRLTDADVPELAAGLAGVRAGIARLRRYDLTGVDIAVQQSREGRL